MDKIAVISDIHANLQALDEVYKDIKKRKVSKIICIGDIIGRGEHPEVAVEYIKEMCEIVLKGNWEDKLVKPIKDEAVRYCKSKLSNEQLDYLDRLPYSADFFMSGKLIRLFHTSSKDLYYVVNDGSPIDERRAMFDNTEVIDSIIDGLAPDVVGFGHTHVAFIQNINGKLLFNAGSVSCSSEEPEASYAILEGNCDSRVPAPFSIQLIRVPCKYYV